MVLDNVTRINLICVLIRHMYHPGLFPGASEAWKQQTRSLSPSHFEYHVRFSFPWCLCQGSPKSRVESAAGCGAVTEERETLLGVGRHSAEKRWDLDGEGDGGAEREAERGLLVGSS